MVTDTNSRLASENSNLTIRKNSEIKTIENSRQKAIAKAQSDLSASESDIQEKLLDIEEKTNDKINSILDKYNEKAYQVYKDHAEKAEKNAKSYIEAFFKTVSNGASSKYLEAVLPTIAAVNAKKDAPKPKAADATTLAGVKYTPTQKQMLQGANIWDAKDPKVAQYFIMTPPEFQDVYTRNATRGINTSGVTLESINRSYEEWVAAKEAAAKKKTGRTI